MTGRRWIALILPAAFLSGCLFPNDNRNNHPDAKQGDEMILYSLAGGFPLNPNDPDQGKLIPPKKISTDGVDPMNPQSLPLKDNGEMFHGWQVLGKTTVASESLRRRINDALEIGIKKHDGSVAACFDPHHAIRFRHNGKTEDWVICFRCNQIYVFENERKIKTTLISTSPRPLLNDVLRAAKVPLSDKAE